MSRTASAAVIVTLVAACGGNESAEESADAGPGSDPVGAEVGVGDTSGSTPQDPSSAVAPDPVAVERCLEDTGLQVRNQDEVDSPYTPDELDFFDLDTELLVEGGDAEYISGSVNFHRTLATAEQREIAFEESVTDYTVGRSGTVVYALVGGTADGELDVFTARIDSCLTEP